MRTWTWRFDAGDATVETESGPGDLEALDVVFRLQRRAYPSEVGRLLSYDDSDRRVVNVAERDVPLDSGRLIRVITLGEASEVDSVAREAKQEDDPQCDPER